jgi:hypothetical protein
MERNIPLNYPHLIRDVLYKRSLLLKTSRFEDFSRDRCHCLTPRRLRYANALLEPGKQDQTGFLSLLIFVCRKINYGAVTGPNASMLARNPTVYETVLVQGDSIYLSGGMHDQHTEDGARSVQNKRQEQKIMPFRAPDGRLYIDNLGSYIERDLPLEIEIAQCLGAAMVWQRSSDEVRRQKAKHAHLVLKEEWACNWNATKFKTTAGAVEADQKTANETLVYHFTTSQAAQSILADGASGFRMSTQGQGDGGVYFSKLGPQGKGST